MDVHGNPDGRDIFGSMPNDVFGMPESGNVHGGLPSDVWGNASPAGGDGGGLLSLVFSLISSIFGGG